MPKSIWTLRDEIEAAEKRLDTFCFLLNAGQRQGGAREFRRAVDMSFKGITDHTEFFSLPYSPVIEDIDEPTPIEAIKTMLKFYGVEIEESKAVAMSNAVKYKEIPDNIWKAWSVLAKAAGVENTGDEDA